jgi:hypothetical protein
MYYLLTWLRCFSAEVHEVGGVGASFVTYVRYCNVNDIKKNGSSSEHLSRVRTGASQGVARASSLVRRIQRRL